MGSFYGVCAVTQRPIRHGENVYMFIIKKNVSFDGNFDIRPTYSSVYWRIASLPIKAKYNDYGFIEDITDEGLANLASFNNNYPIFKDVNDLESISLFFRGKTDSKHFGEFAYMFVHEDVITKASNYPVFNKDEAKIAYDHLISNINEANSKDQVFILTKDGTKSSMTHRELLLMMDGYDQEVYEVIDSYSYDKRFFFHELFSTFSVSRSSSKMVNLWKNFDPKDELSSFNDSYILGVVCYLMSQTRKQVQPQVGFGSQSLNDSEAYNIIVDVLKDFVHNPYGPNDEDEDE